MAPQARASVRARLAREVPTIGSAGPPATRARATLGRLGSGNVHVRAGAGYGGWPEAVPVDAILVTAAPPRIPKPLERQLAVGGRLVIPVGDRRQELRVITRTADGFDERSEFPVRFVPMAGEAQGAD